MEWVNSRLLDGLVLISTAWMALAVHYHAPQRWLRWTWSLLSVLVVLGSFTWLPRYPWALVIWSSSLLLTLIWWTTRKPRSDRDWAPGLDRMPSVQLDGDRLTIHDFRNFNYAAGQATTGYETRTFDLTRLRSLDYFLSHWSGPIMAHTLVSFGFDDGSYLALSVEARRQRWQIYSPLWGLFRAYELIYVLGDERDIVRLRTSVRHERVYMYRLKLTAERIRLLLVDYVQQAESLASVPQWYNSVTSNCTTNLFYHRHRQTRGWLKPGIFLNGLSAFTLYRLGFLADQLPFAKLHAQSLIHEAEGAGDVTADFSQRIRNQLVLPQPPAA